MAENQWEVIKYEPLQITLTFTKNYEGSKFLLKSLDNWEDLWKLKDVQISFYRTKVSLLSTQLGKLCNNYKEQVNFDLSNSYKRWLINILLLLVFYNSKCFYSMDKILQNKFISCYLIIPFKESKRRKLKIKYDVCNYFRNIFVLR